MFELPVILRNELSNLGQIVTRSESRTFARVLVNFVEPIHTQLANETGNVSVLKVQAKDLAKLFTWVDEKAVLGGTPVYHLIQSRVFQHRV